MGWFTSKGDDIAPEPSAPADPIVPISAERVAAFLDSNDWSWGRDDDGDIGGRWGDGTFYFLFQGANKEILQVMGRCLRPVPEEFLDELRVFIEDWHRDHLWPKCYRVRDDDGNYRVVTEVNIDHEHGASTAQLGQQIHCALGTSLQMFEALAERFDLPPLPDTPEA